MMEKEGMNDKIKLAFVFTLTVIFSGIGMQESFADECKPLILDYSIIGGEVSTICNSQSSSVIVRLEASENGELTIEIPTTTIADIDRSCTVRESSYFLLVNNEEASPDKEIVTGDITILTISFVQGHNEIEIISGIHNMLVPNPYKICGIIHGYDNQYLPPAKQMDLGNFLEYIKCNQGLVLIYTFYNNSPACVKTESAEKLEQRGWGNKNMHSFLKVLIDDTELHIDEKVPITVKNIGEIPISTKGSFIKLSYSIDNTLGSWKNVFCCDGGPESGVLYPDEEYSIESLQSFKSDLGYYKIHTTYHTEEPRALYQEFKLLQLIE